MSYAADRERPGFWRLARRAAIAGIVCITAAAYLLSALGDRRIDGLRSAVSDFFEPVLSALSGPMSAGNTVLSDMGGFLDVYEHNRKLREDVVTLSKWREIALRLEAENAELRSLNRVTLAPRFDYITAQVIGNSDGAFNHSLTINAGRAQGVRAGTVVMDGTSVIGRVVSLGENAARVLLITDATSRIPAQLEPGDIRALLIGDNSPYPKLKFITKPNALQSGQRVVTSNHGGVFPKDLPLGAVSDVVEGAARIRPSANFARLEFVRLVIERKDLTIDPDAVLVIGEASDERAEDDEADARPPAGGADEAEPQE